MNLVAITQRTEHITQYHETRDALDQRWHALFTQCNILPIVIPNHLPTATALMHAFTFSGILLTGGNASPERHQVETFLLEHGIAAHLPILGVCHGMQMIQQYYGIPLYPVTGHVCQYQTILSHNEKRIVNSYHDFGTTESRPIFHSWAKANDGIIKAICHQHLPIVGMMWHPERDSQYDERDINLITSLFNTNTIDACLAILRKQHILEEA